MVNEIDRRHEKLHGLNQRVGLVLSIGTILSLLLMAAGLVLFIVTGIPQITSLTPTESLIHDLLILSPAALVTLGFFLIMLMPVVILLTSLAHFIITRETKPVIVCIVLILLLSASYILVLK
jgi:uncharacterized membrane protein